MTLNTQHESLLSWGMLWNHKSEKPILYLKEDVHDFIIQNINGEIRYSRNTSVIKFSLFKKKTRFVIKRICENGEFKIIFKTYRAIDPLIENYTHLQPGQIHLKSKSNKYKCINFDFTLYVFQDIDQPLPSSIIENIKMVSELGKGTFGTVIEVFSILSNQMMAMKTIDVGTKTLTKKIRCLKKEKNYLLELMHPNIVSIHKEESNLSQFCLFMEVGNRGDLLKFITRMPVNETIAKVFFLDILQGLRFIHGKELVHLDIKPQNILLFETSNGLNAKLADFGSVCSLKENSQDKRGTPTYLPPEVAQAVLWSRQKKYKKSTDIFCTGVTIYYSVVGRHPFQSLHRTCWFGLTLKNSDYHQFHFTPSFIGCSAELKELLKKCFLIEEDQRPSVEEMLNDAWFQSTSDS